jgi:hypothetical protein
MATSNVMSEATGHQAIGEAFATANRSMLLDEIWQDFGYRKRPRYGALVQKWRRPWKVQLEKAILREIFVSTIALFVLASKLKLSDVPSVIKVVYEVLAMILLMTAISSHQDTLNWTRLWQMP